MATDLTTLRPARLEDAAALAAAHEEAWRYAYQGIIPHLALSRMIARRGPRWWQHRLGRHMPALLLRFDDEVAGYVTYGRSRMRGTPYGGELFELYIRPVYQGAGFGGTLFRAARRALAQAHVDGLIIWALSDNEPACEFYLHLGGKPVSEGIETFGRVALRKVAFAWT